MSNAVNSRTDWPRSRDVIGAMANAAAAGESAARGAVNGAQALCLVVRDYPVLSVFLASGLGYLLGRARGSVRKRPYVTPVATRR
jgi:F420-dependent methylenetetrahydromethanopterin dehydrogenase